MSCSLVQEPVQSDPLRQCCTVALRRLILFAHPYRSCARHWNRWSLYCCCTGLLPVRIAADLSSFCLRRNPPLTNRCGCCLLSAADQCFRCRCHLQDQSSVPPIPASISDFLKTELTVICTLHVHVTRPLECKINPGECAKVLACF